jgi:phosphoglycerate kinase
MKTVDSYNFSGKKALIRVDFNVPLDDQFHITDDTRIRAAIPTINKILKDGGSVILMSHLGRPKGGPEEKYSLKHIVEHTSRLLKRPVKFAGDCIGEEARRLTAELKDGEVLLLENLRFHKEEEKGDEEFAKELGCSADVYVNDAFGTAHRAHASTAVIAKFFKDKMFGYVMAGELESINKVLNRAEKPLTAILGGSKVSGKIQIITQLMDKVDNLLIGGGMAYTFARALGGKTGASLVEEDKIELAMSIVNEARSKNVKLYLPSDTVVADAFSNDANKKTCDINDIPDGWMGLDIGPETAKKYEEVILQSKTVLWNGPMGVFEMEKFEDGTKAVASALVKATQKGTYTLIGGGDSVAAINKYNLGDRVSYVSTGGGALLEYIESGSLPGVEAVEI